MTREEAIFYIKELQKTYASMDKKVAEAIDMAIEALSAEPKMKVCEERQNGECPFYTPDWLDDDVSEPSDLISRADAIEAVEGLTKYMEKLVEGAEKFPEAHTKNYKHDMEQQIMGVAHASQVILELPSAEAVSKYTEWLEKIIVEMEPTFLCEEPGNPEWCYKNCVYSSIQVECLRQLYKGGDSE